MVLSEAKELYLRKCQIRNLAVKTIKNYELSISTFSQFYHGELDNLGQDDIDDYIYYLQQEKKISLATVNNRLRDLRAFLKWCESRGYIKGVKVQLIKHNEPEIHAFSPQDLEQIYDACLMRIGRRFQQGDSFCAKRNYTLMRVMEETGMRITECLKIRVNDLDLKYGTIFIRETKNKKNRIVYITPGLIKDIKQYINYQQKFLADKKIVPTTLFCNKTGSNLNIKTIQDAIALYGDMANISNVRVSPHTFRHTFAKNFLLNGGDIFTLKDILGHSTLDMVYRYARLFSNERQQKYMEVMKRYNRSKKRIVTHKYKYN